MEYKKEKYRLLITTGNHQMVVDTEIRVFGRWKSGSSDFCTKGVIYPIVGDGYFDGTVKFLNNKAHVDEASTVHFDLATNKEYSEQFKRLEVKPISEQKVAKRKRSVASKAKSGNKSL